MDNIVYESDNHIQKVLHKIFRPDNAYVKFGFENGRPQKSAILTTNSIEMAKRYYKAIKKITKEADWMRKEFPSHPIREGRTMDDPDFPRIAITYSLEENIQDANEKRNDMEDIIKDYNSYYGTAWSLTDIERYNGDINNRLARKKQNLSSLGNRLTWLL